MEKKLVIIGAGDFAKELVWIIQEVNKVQCSLEIVGLLDEDNTKEGLQVLGCRVFGELKTASFWGEGPVYAVCSVAKPASKKMLCEKVRAAGYHFAKIVHPSAVISEYVTIGEGSVIMPGTIVTVDVEVGKHVTINKLCSIGHDSIIKDFCTLAPGVKVGGKVVIEEECDIGMNASIIQSVRIGKGTTVGAGAVVTGDLPGGCTAVGVPARVMK